MQYNPPAGSQDPNAPFVNGLPGVRKGSAVPAEAVEYPQREILAVIEAAGLDPTNADLTQLLQAIRELCPSAPDMSLASDSANGLMSKGDFSKLAGIQAGAQVNPNLASASANGLMSAADFSKLDGIQKALNAYDTVIQNAADITPIPPSNLPRGHYPVGFAATQTMGMPSPADCIIKHDWLTTNNIGIQIAEFFYSPRTMRRLYHPSTGWGGWAEYYLFNSNQQWWDVTSNRAFNTTYTNSTYNTMMVNVMADSNNETGYLAAYAGGVTAAMGGSYWSIPNNSVVSHATVSFIVPPQSTYRINANPQGSGTLLLRQWSEWS